MNTAPQPHGFEHLSQHRSVLVLGLGVTGYSVVRYLRKAEVDVTVMDSRETPPKAAQLAQDYPEVHCVFGRLDAEVIAGFSLVVISPGLDLASPELKSAREQGTKFIGDIELFLQANEKPLIAITGSNGKSTVTTLVGKICEQAGLSTLVAGNIGYPALEALTDDVDYDVAVLELSSFQLETTTAVPADAATILNISPDHMDRYPSMGDYMLAKARIFRGASRVILPRHQENLSQITTTAEAITFGLDDPSKAQDFGVRGDDKARWLVKGDERLIKLKNIPLLGQHNVENVLAALALVDVLDLPVKTKAAAIKNFSGLPHRMETVAAARGVTWVNDSKATNIGAAATALRSLDSSVIWIAGGQGKDADFTQLNSAITHQVKHIILLGEDAAKIDQALAVTAPVIHVADMATAVQQAGSLADKGTVVLLSPACASFDMYQSFAQRGDDFRQLAQNWVQEHQA